jgi:ABC-type sugar transport system ATPase subunit
MSHMASIHCVNVSKRFGVDDRVAPDQPQERVHRTLIRQNTRESRSDTALPNGPFLALNNVNLDVKDGESMVIVGSSGCGKSTLLRCIAGLESYEGQIFYGEDNVRDVAPRDRGIGIVFQNYALYPQFEAQGNLSFFFRLRKRDAEIPERVRQTSEIMGLGFDALLDRKPSTLSGGQKQRVAIARAICRDPKLLLFDEPLSNLDAHLRASTRIEIRRLINRFHITTLYVTHDQTEATIMGDRLCVMDQGHVMQLGTYHELYDHPLNAFVAGFLGTPAMNLLEGSIEDQHIVVASVRFPLPDRVHAYVTRGQRVVVGFRPEHVALISDADSNSAQAQLSVEWIERIPSDRVQLVYFFLDIGGNHSRLVAKWPIDLPLALQQVCNLSIDAAHVHIFDPNNGRRI